MLPPGLLWTILEWESNYENLKSTNPLSGIFDVREPIGPEQPNRDRKKRQTAKVAKPLKVETG